MKQYASLKLQGIADQHGYAAFSNYQLSMPDYTSGSSVLERMQKDGWVVINTAIQTKLSTSDTSPEYVFLFEPEVA